VHAELEVLRAPAHTTRGAPLAPATSRCVTYRAATVMYNCRKPNEKIPVAVAKCRTEIKGGVPRNTFAMPSPICMATIASMPFETARARGEVSRLTNQFTAMITTNK